MLFDTMLCVCVCVADDSFWRCIEVCCEICRCGVCVCVCVCAASATDAYAHSWITFFIFFAMVT